jgi:hypothetical protein
MMSAASEEPGQRRIAFNGADRRFVRRANGSLPTRAGAFDPALVTVDCAYAIVALTQRPLA